MLLGLTIDTEGKMINNYRTYKSVISICSGCHRDTQSLSITYALQRTLTALYRRLCAYSHLQSGDLRTGFVNGLIMRMLSVLKGEQYRKNFYVRQ